MVELGKALLKSAEDGDTNEVKNLIGRGAPMTADWLGKGLFKNYVGNISAFFDHLHCKSFRALSAIFTDKILVPFRDKIFFSAKNTLFVNIFFTPTLD